MHSSALICIFSAYYVNQNVDVAVIDKKEFLCFLNNFLSSRKNSTSAMQFKKITEKCLKIQNQAKIRNHFDLIILCVPEKKVSMKTLHLIEGEFKLGR